MALLITTHSFAQIPNKKYQFTAGFSNYPSLDENEQLKRTVQDAMSVSAALSTVGFNSPLPTLVNASRNEFHEKWDDFIKKINPGDEVAIFISGHGVEINNENYILPSDVPFKDFTNRRKLIERSINLDVLFTDIRHKSPSVSIFIIDACRDDPFIPYEYRRSTARKKAVFIKRKDGIRTVKRTGHFAIYAAQSGETAIEQFDHKDQSQNSLFTRHLLPLITTRNLSLQELALKIRTDVGKAAFEKGEVQNPTYEDGLDFRTSRYCLAGCDDPNQKRQDSEARIAWELIKDIEIVDVLNKFKNKYQGTKEALAAEIRIRKLQTANEGKAPPQSEVASAGSKETASTVFESSEPANNAFDLANIDFERLLSPANQSRRAEFVARLTREEIWRASGKLAEVIELARNESDARLTKLLEYQSRPQLLQTAFLSLTEFELTIRFRDEANTKQLIQTSRNRIKTFLQHSEELAKINREIKKSVFSRNLTESEKLCDRLRKTSDKIASLSEAAADLNPDDSTECATVSVIRDLLLELEAKPAYNDRSLIVERIRSGNLTGWLEAPHKAILNDIEKKDSARISHLMELTLPNFGKTIEDFFNLEFVKRVKICLSVELPVPNWIRMKVTDAVSSYCHRVNNWMKGGYHFIF